MYRYSLFKFRCHEYQGGYRHAQESKENYNQPVKQVCWSISRYTYILLDVLVCSTTVYFYESKYK